MNNSAQFSEIQSGQQPAFIDTNIPSEPELYNYELRLIGACVIHNYKIKGVYNILTGSNFLFKDYGKLFDLIGKFNFDNHPKNPIDLCDQIANTYNLTPEETSILYSSIQHPLSVNIMINIAYDIKTKFLERSLAQITKNLAKNPLSKDIKEQYTAVYNELESLKSQNIWPALKPITKPLLPVKQFIPEILPLQIRAWGTDISNRLQIPLDYIAVSSITVIASIIGARCGIRPKEHDSWLVTPNLYGAIVGPPSSLKTPTLNEALSPLRHLQKEAQDIYDEEMAAFLKAKEIFNLQKDAAKSAIKNQTKDSFKSGNQAEEKANFAILEELEAPKEPHLKRYYTNDATIEKIGEILSTNPHGILIACDELESLFTHFQKQGHEGDRTFFLEGWNGTNAHRVDRIGRGSINVPNLCLGLIGSIQPGKLIKYVNQSMSRTGNDGLLQRLQLLVYPDPVLNWKNVDQKPNYAAKEAVENIYHALATDKIFDLGAYQDDHSKLPYFKFSEDAQKIFNEWYEELQAKIVKTEKINEPLAEHLSKYASLMPSLALIFHLIDIVSKVSPSCQFISEDNASKAAAWCTILESHAERIYGLHENEIEHSAITLSQKIMAKKLPQEFTLRQVYRPEWSGLKTRESALLAIETLIKHGWIKSKNKNNEGPYLVNPKVYEEDNS